MLPVAAAAEEGETAENEAEGLGPTPAQVVTAKTTRKVQPSGSVLFAVQAAAARGARWTADIGPGMQFKFAQIA
jgi:hypothetical protein